MPCQCHDAALRAYQTLKDSGRHEEHAYEAAVRIYRHYHPNRPRIEAYQEVAEWLDQQEYVDAHRGVLITDPNTAGSIR